MLMIVRKSFILTLLCLVSSVFVFADDGNATEEFDASETILHHVLDTHDWHITDIPSGKDEHGKTHYIPVALHLPWLFYSSRDGVQFVGSTEGLAEKGYMALHDHLYPLKAGVTPPVDAHGHVDMDEKAFEEWEVENIDHHTSVYDFSITKASLHMIMVGIAMLLVFSAVARGYKKNAGKAPSGIQSMFEPIIVFIRDEVAKPYLHDKTSRFLPYLLSLFFFIWFSNLFGLTPFNSNVMGNISVTAALAVLTFLLINFNGTKDYWVHIFNTPGVPWVLKFGIPLMPIVEIIGVFTKPFALMIRLFANISAGHFMVLSLVCMIFILGKNGAQPGGAFGIMPLSFAFTTAIFVLEMVVAIIQAYIFTLLTTVFVGMALESHDDHH